MGVPHQEMRLAMQGFVATPTPGDFIPRMMTIPFAYWFYLKGSLPGGSLFLSPWGPCVLVFVM